MKNAGIRYAGYGSDELDITEQSAVDRVLRDQDAELVVNCAAYTAVDRAEKEREKAEEINATAVGRLARNCMETETKLVHFSTDYIFPGEKEDRLRFPGGYPEDHEPAPVNWYGETKLRGEQAIRSSGVTHLIIRTSWLCGRDGSNFVTTMLRLAGERERLDVVNDQWGSPSFAENVVGNTLNLVQQRMSGTYHITSEGLVTWFELARELITLAGEKATVNPVPSEKFETAARRPYYSKLNIDKLRSVAGAEIWEWKKGLQRLMSQIG